MSMSMRCERTLELHFEVDVEAEGLAVAEVGHGRRVLRLLAGHDEGRERLERHHPRRDGRAQVLRRERAERLVLEQLHVARAPVVEQHEACEREREHRHIQ